MLTVLVDRCNMQYVDVFHTIRNSLTQDPLVDIITAERNFSGRYHKNFTRFERKHYKQCSHADYLTFLQLSQSLLNTVFIISIRDLL